MAGRFYRLDDEETSMLSERDEHQILRHFVLVIALCVAQLAVRERGAQDSTSSSSLSRSVSFVQLLGRNRYI